MSGSFEQQKLEKTTKNIDLMLRGKGLKCFIDTKLILYFFRYAEIIFISIYLTTFHIVALMHNDIKRENLATTQRRKKV